jgi:hypothetical protein
MSGTAPSKAVLAVVTQFDENSGYQPEVGHGYAVKQGQKQFVVYFEGKRKLLAKCSVVKQRKQAVNVHTKTERK